MRSLLVIALALAAAPAFAAPPSTTPNHQQLAPPLPTPPARTNPFDLRTAPQLDDLVIQNQRRDMTGREPYRVPRGDDYRFQLCTLGEVVVREECEQLSRQQPRLFLLSPDLRRFSSSEPAAAAPLPPPCEPPPTANAPATKPAGPAPCPVR